MFRFEEDAYLRKGGDFSRNCLSFEAEENEAQKVPAPLLAQEPELRIKKCKTVVVSAGGRATEFFVKALLADQVTSWVSESFGVLG